MSKDPSSQDSIVRALRDAAPYMLAHQGRTVVVVANFGPSSPEKTPTLLADLVLLGRVAQIRFALAYDVRNAAAGGNANQDVLPSGRTPVSEDAMSKLQDAARDVRDEVEAVLSDGLPGLKGMGTVAGPMPAAHRVGFVKGADMGLMGTPKAFEADDAKSLLQTGKAVLLSPLGRNTEGETLHLDAREVALAFAKACQADKLMVLVDEAEMAELGFRELTVEQAKGMLDDGRRKGTAAALMELGLRAMASGTDRVHFVNAHIPGGLLLELLSPDGVAAMISKDPFDAVRQATSTDVSSVAELIAPGVSSGALAPRSRQDLVDGIGNFAVVARDDALIACAAMERHGDNAEFGCLAVRPEYANQAYGQLLLDFFEAKGRQEGLQRMLVVTTVAADWFKERGYTPCDIELLPPNRRARVQAGDDKRSAFVLSKIIS